MGSRNCVSTPNKIGGARQTIALRFNKFILVNKKLYVGPFDTSVKGVRRGREGSDLFVVCKVD